MSDLVARRQMNRGYDDGFSRAVEIVVTPVLFGFLGSVADGWAGTRPLFTILLATVAVIGIFVKLWLGYDRQMRAHEAGAVWGRRSGDAAATVAPPAAAAPSHDAGEATPVTGNGPPAGGISP